MTDLNWDVFYNEPGRGFSTVYLIKDANLDLLLEAAKKFGLQTEEYAKGTAEGLCVPTQSAEATLREHDLAIRVTFPTQLGFEVTTGMSHTYYDAVQEREQASHSKEAHLT